MSGQIPVRSGGGPTEIVGETMQEETRQALRNVETWVGIVPNQAALGNSDQPRASRLRILKRSASPEARSSHSDRAVHPSH